MPSPTRTNPVEVTTGDHPGAADATRPRTGPRHVAAPGRLTERLAATARAAWRAVRPRRSAHRAEVADGWAEVILARLRAGHDVVLIVGAVTA
jgi:hypothetical protein